MDQGRSAKIAAFPLLTCRYVSLAPLARSAPLRTLARRLVHTEARIAELGHTLPSMPSALGLYVPAVRMGNVIHTAGHIPFDDPLCATRPSNPLAPAVS